MNFLNPLITMVLPPRGHCRNDVLHSRGTVAVLFFEIFTMIYERIIGNVYGADDLLFSHVERLYDDYRNCHNYHNYHNLKQSTQISSQFFYSSFFLLYFSVFNPHPK